MMRIYVPWQFITVVSPTYEASDGRLTLDPAFPPLF
jgi:hypothetical protein